MTSTDDALASAASGRPFGRRSARGRLLQLGLPLATLGLFVFFSLASDVFLDASNLGNVARQSSALLIVACGQAFVILGGGLDLSVGSMIGVASVVAALMTLEYGILPGFASGILVALLIGGLNGLVVARLSLDPFIVTLASLSIVRGLALTLAGGTAIQGMPSDFSYIGYNDLLGLPIPAIVAGLVFLGAYAILRWTRFGRYVYAIGGNREAARLSGLPVARWRMAMYAMSGGLAGIAGVLLSSRVSSGQPTLGTGMELQSVAAVMLGGVSLYGGRGSLMGVLFGVLFISLLSNGLNLLNVSSYVQLMVIGVALVLAIALDSFFRARRTGRG